MEARKMFLGVLLAGLFLSGCGAQEHGSQRAARKPLLLLAFSLIL